jgi:hypothetical protein
MLDELFGFWRYYSFWLRNLLPLVSFNIPVLKGKLEKLFLEVTS